CQVLVDSCPCCHPDRAKSFCLKSAAFCVVVERILGQSSIFGCLLQRDKFADSQRVLLGLEVVGLVICHNAMVCYGAKCVNRPSISPIYNNHVITRVSMNRLGSITVSLRAAFPSRMADQFWRFLQYVSRAASFIHHMPLIGSRAIISATMAYRVLI